MILSSLNPLTIQGDTLGSPLDILLPSLGRALALGYRCGGRTGVIAPRGYLGEIRWTPPLALAEAFPDRERIPVTLILEAYAGDEIADSREEQVLLALPARLAPKVELRVTPEAGSRFLRGSRARVEVTASGILGAEIADCTLRCGGLTGQGQTLLFDLPETGEIPVTARVTDSRGRSSQATVTISVEPGQPGGETPLLDIAPEARALGIGCRGDRENTLSMGMTLSMGGQPLRGLPEAREPEDALPLGQAERRFLGLRRLWENPSPGEEFPAQTIAATGGLLLVEAAAQAGSRERVWEILGSAGAIRVLSGSTVAQRSLRQTEAGLECGSAVPGDDWAIPLAIYVLKEGSET